MRYLSLFSGIEACTAAWHPLGWEPVAYCEFEKFPSAVLAHHYPDVVNLGDVTKITDQDIKTLGPIDLVVGGSPCQDLSVAGKRAGLAGERSGLFYEQLRIFRAARSFCGARFLLWENVPGAFSSHGGADFAQVVGEMAGCQFTLPRDTRWRNTGIALGQHGLVEWRTLDAQYVRVESHSGAVPQRRRRVFALLDTGDWSSRPPILFEPESLRGDSPPSREKGQKAAPTISARTKGGGGLGTDFDLDGGLIQESVATLDASFGKLQGCSGQDANHGHSHLIAFGQNNTSGPNDISHGLNANRGTHNPGDFEAGTLLVESISQNQRGEVRTSEVMPSLSKAGGIPGQGMPVIAFSSKDHGADAIEDCCPTMRAGGHDNSHANAGVPPAVMMQDMAVRRLTPRECERLQGFPDDYTQIPWRGKSADKCPDGPRYKALGNSMAVPVMNWIGQRIQESIK